MYSVPRTCLGPSYLGTDVRKSGYTGRRTKKTTGKRGSFYPGTSSVLSTTYISQPYSGKPLTCSRGRWGRSSLRRLAINLLPSPNTSFECISSCVDMSGRLQAIADIVHHKRGFHKFLEEVEAAVIKAFPPSSGWLIDPSTQEPYVISRYKAVHALLLS